MTKSKLNLLFPLVCLVLCLLFPAVCAEGVRQGLAVSMESALPALYPSLVLSSLLTKVSSATGEKCFLIPFFLGICCGFPVGAASVATLVRDGKLSKTEGEKLIFFCNNAGAVFLVSFCGQGILGDAKKGFLLLILQSALSALFLFLFFGKRLLKRKKTEKSAVGSPLSLWKSFPSALRESAFSFLYIVSCIIFFSFFTQLIGHLFSMQGLPLSLLSLFTEICGGLIGLRHLPLSAAFPLCAMGCGWGGLSVHLQTAGILEESGLSYKNFLLGRALFAVSMLLLTLFLQKLL